MAVQGLDVSSIQGSKFDFNKVKAAGYDFVILRINTWDNTKHCNVKDPCFDSFYQKAVAAGLKVGAYWFSYANTADYAATEAALCIRWIKGKKYEYPIYFDLERKEQFDQGTAFCDAAVKTFCSALENAGYFAGVYCSTFWHTHCVSKAVRERYACWIAEYAAKCHYTGPYGIWQNGLVYVNGIQVDHDYAYVDYPALIKKKGLNGFSKPAAAAETPSQGFKPYIVRITYKSGLNIRSGPGVAYKIVGSVPYRGAYTIVREQITAGQTWGKLKSGAGWICLTGFTEIHKR